MTEGSNLGSKETGESPVKCSPAKASRLDLDSCQVTLFGQMQYSVGLKENVICRPMKTVLQFGLRKPL